jgi:hypothetical protein
MTQRMAKVTIILSYLVLLCSRYVQSDLLYDQCEAYCEKTYPGISIANVSSDLQLFCELHGFDLVLTHPRVGSKCQPHS